MIRHGDAGELLGRFLVAGIAAVIVIRLFLALTGYPHVGEHGLHVAHTLWGGLSMVVALVIALLFQGHRARRFVALLGGIGFGVFIDEVGKFMSASHNYFYRPAIPLIYLGFVALFLIVWALKRAPSSTPRESLADALSLYAETAGRPVDPDTVRRIRALLERVEPGDPVAEAIGRSLVDDPGAVDRHLAPVRWRRRVETRLATTGDKVAAIPLISRALAVALPLTAIGMAGSVAYANISWGVAEVGGSWSLIGVAHGASSVVGTGLVVVGLGALPRSRKVACRWLQGGLLVWILVTQVFVFYGSQSAGLAGLALNLAAYGVIGFAFGRRPNDPTADRLTLAP